MSSKFTARQQRQRFFLKSQSEKLAPFIRESYAREGRGAVVFTEDRATDTTSQAMYISQAALEIKGQAWPDDWVAERVHSYDPERQFVIIFTYTDGSTDTHIGRLIAANVRAN